jgi:hypothetical protein
MYKRKTGLNRYFARTGEQIPIATLATIGRPIIHPMSTELSVAIYPRLWMTLEMEEYKSAFESQREMRNISYLVMIRPDTSSKRAALIRTMPTFVWAKSTPPAALPMTTNVVPREVVERAAPTIKVSIAPRRYLVR